MHVSGWRIALLVLLLAAAAFLFALGQATQAEQPPEPSPTPGTVRPAPAPEPTASPAPPASPEPAETPAPSAAPEPASAPLPASEPEPTAEPEPVPTAEPEPLPESWFDDALFLGDSLTGSLASYSLVSGGLGDALILHVNGLGCHHIIRDGQTIPFMGKSMTLENAVAASGCGKLFLMLAMNDIGTEEPDYLRSCWDTLLDRLAATCPQVTVYVQSGTPVRQDVSYFTRENMEAYNNMLRELCLAHGCVYVDVTEGLVDENGFMKPEFQQDNVHMNPEGCRIWVRNLRDPASYSVPPLPEGEERA